MNINYLSMEELKKVAQQTNKYGKLTENACQAQKRIWEIEHPFYGISKKCSWCRADLDYYGFTE